MTQPNTEELSHAVYPPPEVLAAMETLVTYTRTLPHPVLSYTVPDAAEPGGFLLLCLGSEGVRAMATWSRMYDLAELHRERREGGQR